LPIEIWDGGIRRAVVTANQTAAYAAPQCGGNTARGFRYDLPASMRNGQPHALTIRAADLSAAAGASTQLGETR
jgi:hypothetical protein